MNDVAGIGAGDVAGIGAGNVAGNGAGAVSGIGATPRRREDARFLTGQGRYLDDIAFPGAAHAVFLRAGHAHAILRGIDTAAARAMPGVLAILTAQDVAQDGLRPLRPTVEANVQTNEPFRFLPQPLLAQGPHPLRRRTGRADRRRDPQPGDGCRRTDRRSTSRRCRR